MAIIFPENCKGITAGALRQIKATGGTTNCGGFFSVKAINNLVGSDLAGYFSKSEPCGVFMNELSNQVENIDNTTDAILKSSRNMVDAARDANKQMADASGKMRDSSEKLGSAIDKMLKIAGRSDFAEVVKLTESFVTSLERLAVLDERGLLEKVMKAMSSGK